MKRTSLAVLILTYLLLLAGCQAAEPQAEPEIETLLVQITPAARPVIPAVQACGALITGVDLQIVERFASQSAPGLVIRLGEPPDGTEALAQIATEQISIILHPENSAASLTPDQIRDLFTGKTASWADIGGADIPVSVWVLYPADEVQQAFERQLLSGIPLVSSANLAPDPEALRGAVAANPAAIGLLPSAWNREGLQTILIGLRLPVLISSSLPFEGPSAELAACLQGETGQTVLNAIYP